MNRVQNIAISLLSGSVLVCFPGISYGKPNQVQFSQIYSAVANRKLKPNSAGVVNLPTTLATATADGKVYVTRKGKLLMVLFPTWRGKGSNLRGYLRCNRSLTPTDTHQDEYEQKHDAVNVFAPGAWSEPASSPQFRTPPVQRQTEVILEKKLRNHTYYVSHSID